MVDGRPLNLKPWLRYKETFNLFRHLASNRIDCYVSNADDGVVWIIERGMLAGLERMMQDLQVKGRSLSKCKKAEVGKLVGARFTQDGDYYRARVMSMSGGEAEVHYLDFGNKETLPLDQLLELNKEFIHHPGYAMKVELDCKGECRMVAPGEMESLIANGNLLAAELVQPRRGIVRLYHEGQRVGYQPPCGVGGLVSPLPPARLRLGCERIGITTMVSPSSFAVQDIVYAEKVVGRLRREDLEPVDSKQIETGGVYIQVEGSEIQRLIVESCEGPSASVKYVDAHTTGEVALTSLYNCSAAATTWPPAALTAANLTASTRDRYMLTGQMVVMSVVDNTLRLAPRPLSVSFVVNQALKFETRCALPEVLLYVAEMVRLNRLTSAQLTATRNNLLQHCLNDQTLDLDALKSDPQEAAEVQDLNSDPAVELDDLKSGPIVESCFDDTDTTTFSGSSMFSSVLILDAGKKSVKIHENLPELILNEVENFTVLASFSGHCTLSLNRCKHHLDELNEKLMQIEEKTIFECREKVLGLYSGDAQSPGQRCLVLDQICDIVEIYLVDTGRTVLCDPQELSNLPDSLSTIPPTVLVVKTNRSFETGQIFDGSLVFGEHLELKVET